MIKPIAAIAWPSDRKDAVKLLQKYMITVLHEIGISFDASARAPVAVVQGLVDGTLSESDRRAALAHWWALIDEQGIRDFSARDSLLARLAVSLLSPTPEDALDLGEQLSWFLEVLGLMQADVDKAIDRMHRHFSFQSI